MHEKIIYSAEVKFSAMRLKSKLALIDDPLAKSWLNGEFGVILENAIEGSLSEVSIPHFDFFSHGGMPQAEEEYFDFYFAVKNSKK